MFTLWNVNVTKEEISVYYLSWLLILFWFLLFFGVLIEWSFLISFFTLC